MIPPIVFIAIALAAASASAQVHRCIDAAGKATFSDTPCPASAKRPGQPDECQTTSSQKGCIGASRSANSNGSPQRGYYGGGGLAEQQYAREQEQARQAAAGRAAPPPPPALLTNCNAGGCWDSQGNRYNTTGDGSRFLNGDGRLCTASGKFITCN